MGLVLGALLAAGSALGAQEATADGAGSSGPVLTLDLKGALERALEANVTVRRAVLDTEAKKEALDLSWTGFVPGLDAGASLSAKPSVNLKTGTDSLSASYPSLSLSASTTLSASVLQAEKTARQAWETSVLALAQARSTVIFQVRKSWRSLQLQEAQIRLGQQKIDRAAVTLESTRTQYRNGLASELQVLKAQLALEQLKPAQETLKVTYENALDSFQSLLGLDPRTELRISGVLGLPEDDGTWEKNLRQKLEGMESLALGAPDLATLRTSLQTAQLNLETARLSSVLPSFTLSAGLSGGPSWAGSSGTGTDSLSLSGSLSLSVAYDLTNLFSWSDAQTAIRTKERTIRDLELQIEQTGREGLVTVRNLVKEARQSLTSLGVLKLNEKLASRTYELELQAYRNGTSDLESLQSTEGDLESARVDLLKQQYTLISGLLDLEKACGLEAGSLGGMQ